jgi:hypothetical protein
MARNYSSIVEPKTLSADVPASGTNSDRVSLSPNIDGLPSAPFVLVLNPDTSNEEVVLVTSQISGPTYAITRNIEGGGVKSHTVGQIVKHMIVGSDLQIVHDHFSNASTTTGTAHGATGGVVGRTNSQTLTNKGISLADNTLTGTKAQFNAALSDDDFATVTGTETLTNKTLTSPKLNENVVLTSSATELNVLDGITATTAQLNYVTGVTSAIQTQLDAKTTALTAHEADTTAIHGITDTSKLATIVSASVGRKLSVQAVAPTSPAIGDIWFQVTGL